MASPPMMWASDIEDASQMASPRTVWTGDRTSAPLCLLAHGAIPSLKTVEAEIVLLLILFIFIIGPPTPLLPSPHHTDFLGNKGKGLST